jgi:ubiquitin carboxyl-terminal hydrolase 4/11/15
MILKHENNKIIQKENYQKSLNDCLSLFLESEYLEGDDQKIYCKNCKDRKNFYKQYKLDRLPPVLIISLKRFKFAKLYKTKIDNLIDFPIYDLDLSEFSEHKFLSDDLKYKYDLYGIIVNNIFK